MAYGFNNDKSKVEIYSKTEVDSEIDNVNDRIDNIITSPAPTEQEIIDARLGADGVTYPSLGDAIRDQVSDLKSDIDQLSDLAYTEINKTASVLTEYATEGYIDYNIGTLTPLSNYHCYYFTMPFTCDVWFDTQTEWGQIAVYDGEIFNTANLVSIGSLSRDTLPYESNKLKVERGMNVVICISTVDFTFHYATARRLSETQLEYVDESLGIESIQNAVDSIAEFRVFDYTKDSQELSLYEQQGYISSYNGAFFPLANYDCYSLGISEDSEIWFDEAHDPDWIQIAVYNGTIFDTTKWLGTYGINKNTLPTSASKLSVASGCNIVVCISRNDFKMHITNNVDYAISDEQVDYIKDKIGVSSMSIQKVSPSEFRVTVPTKAKSNSVVYKFIRHNKTWASLDYVDGQGVTQQAVNIVSADCWNNIEVLDGNGVHIAQGNSNFVVKTTDANYHCGDGHGNEVIEYIGFLCDGEPLDIDAMAIGNKMVCSDFRMIQRTKMYKVGGCVSETNEYDTNYPSLDTNGNPVVYFKHFMEVHITSENEVDIKNNLLVLHNGIQFSQCHGAMLECNYGTFSEIICNNNEQTRNEVSLGGTFTVPSDSTINLKNTSQKCDFVEMYGDNFYISQKMQQNNINRWDKSRVYVNDYGNRCKCYFQPVVADLGKLSGETIETFNNGDLISVTNRRVIELN